MVFFEGHSGALEALVHAGDAHDRAGGFLPELAVFLEGSVVVGVELLEQSWLEFGADFASSPGAFEGREVVEVALELQVAVDAGRTDLEGGGSLLGCLSVVLDGGDDAFPEVN
jgi:hypothetical protein